MVVSRLLKWRMLHHIALFVSELSNNLFFILQERKCFVARSKVKRRQTWCNQSTQQREAENSRQETSQETQYKKLNKIAAKTSTLRVSPLSLDPESSAGGESSCIFMVEGETSDERVTRNRNYLAENVTPEGEHLTQGNKKTLFQQAASESELCDDSDATVCELPDVYRSPTQHAPKDREACTPAADPPTDVLHTDDQSQTGQTEDEPESQSLLHSLQGRISDINNDSVCNETRVKQRKKKKKHRVHGSTEDGMGRRQEEPEGLHAAKSVNVDVEETPRLSEDNRTEPPALQTSDELGFNERNCMENSSHDIPDSKQKKKKRKKCAAENVRQEVDGSGVRMEDSVFSVNYDVENGGKKKKRERSDEDVEQLQSGAADEPLNDGAGRVQVKKKKRKKDKTIVVAGECEKKESRNRTLDLLPTSTGQLEGSGNGLDDTEGTLEPSYVKKKKHKKKQRSSNDAPQDGEDVAAVSFSNDASTLEERTGKSRKKKKKKKNISDGVDVSYTPEENEEFGDNTQKTKEGHEDQNAELVTKKKKKKKGDIFSRITSEDSVAPSDDSASVRKKEKKRTSSFLVADAEEKGAQTRGEQNSPSQSVNTHAWSTENPSVSDGEFEADSAEITGHLEESNDGVRKKNKKRKRKMSIKQDSVEKDHKGDFEEPNKTCALPETTDTGVKRKKKRLGHESYSVTPVERLESAADSGHSPSEEDVVLKKKKKKRKDKTCLVIEENPPTASEDTESEKCALNTGSVVSHKKKGKCLTFPLVSRGKHGRSADISHASSTFDQATKETLNVFEQASPSSETPGDQALKDKRDKKRTKSLDNILLQEKLLIKSAQLEPNENKKKEKKKRNKQSHVPNSITSCPVLSEISVSKSETSSSDHIMNNKHTKVRRKLYNPSEDFLGR